MLPAFYRCTDQLHAYSFLLLLLSADLHAWVLYGSLIIINVYVNTYAWQMVHESSTFCEAHAGRCTVRCLHAIVLPQSYCTASR